MGVFSRTHNLDNYPSDSLKIQRKTYSAGSQEAGRYERRYQLRN